MPALRLAEIGQSGNDVIRCSNETRPVSARDVNILPNENGVMGQCDEEAVMFDEVPPSARGNVRPLSCMTPDR